MVIEVAENRAKQVKKFVDETDGSRCFLCGKWKRVTYKCRRVPVCGDCKNADLGRVGYLGFDGNENLLWEVRDLKKEKLIIGRILENWNDLLWTSGRSKKRFEQQLQKLQSELEETLF